MTASFTPQNRVTAQVSVSRSQGGMIGFDLPISQPTLQPPTSSHQTPSLPVTTTIPCAPTASSNRSRPPSPSLHYRATNGAGSGTATSSSDGSDHTHKSATDTTSRRSQYRDGSSSRTSRGHRILGDYTLSKTLGVGIMGRVKLATHNVTGEKVLVTPSQLTSPHHLFPLLLPACCQDSATQTYLVTPHKPPGRGR